MKIFNIPFLTFSSIIFAIICVVIATIWGIFYKPEDKNE